MWDKVISEPPQRQNWWLVLECDSQELEWESDSATENPWGGHSESRSVQNSPKDEWPGKSTPVPWCEETQMEVSVGPSSQDIIQMHMGEDDLN